MKIAIDPQRKIPGIKSSVRAYQDSIKQSRGGNTRGNDALKESGAKGSLLPLIEPLTLSRFPFHDIKV